MCLFLSGSSSMPVNACRAVSSCCCDTWLVCAMDSLDSSLAAMVVDDVVAPTVLEERRETAGGMHGVPSMQASLDAGVDGSGRLWFSRTPIGTRVATAGSTSCSPIPIRRLTTQTQAMRRSGLLFQALGAIMARIFRISALLTRTQNPLDCQHCRC